MFGRTRTPWLRFCPKLPTLRAARLTVDERRLPGLWTWFLPAAPSSPFWAEMPNPGFWSSVAIFADLHSSSVSWFSLSPILFPCRWAPPCCCWDGSPQASRQEKRGYGPVSPCKAQYKQEKGSCRAKKAGINTCDSDPEPNRAGQLSEHHRNRTAHTSYYDKVNSCSPSDSLVEQQRSCLERAGMPWSRDKERAWIAHGKRKEWLGHFHAL